jgi:hypothetical protein
VLSVSLLPGPRMNRVAYSTLNYKDGLAITGRSPVVRKFPMVPGIDLPGQDRDEVLDRLKLARAFLGTRDSLDFFRNWKTPEERYRPLFKENVPADPSED